MFVGVEEDHLIDGDRTGSDGLAAIGGAAFGVNMPLGGNWNAGIDGIGSGSSGDPGLYPYAAGGGGVHLFWRNLDYAVGLFGTGFALYQNGESGTPVAGGVEAAIFYPESTITLQAGYLSRLSGVLGIESDNELVSHGMMFQFGYRRFLDDEMLLDAGAVGAWGQIEGQQNEFGAGGLTVVFEHKPDGWPVSYFLGGTALAGAAQQKMTTVSVLVFPTTPLSASASILVTRP